MLLSWCATYLIQCSSDFTLSNPAYKHVNNVHFYELDIASFTFLFSYSSDLRFLLFYSRIIALILS